MSPETAPRLLIVDCTRPDTGQHNGCLTDVGCPPELAQTRSGRLQMDSLSIGKVVGLQKKLYEQIFVVSNCVQ